VDYDKTGVHDYKYNDPIIDVAKSIAFTDDKGAKIPYAPKSLPCLQDTGMSADATMTLEIPDSTKSVKVTYAPTGSFTANKYGAKQQPTQLDFLGTAEVFPKQGTFAFKPLVFTVTVPQ
jgi:hypothetical protein